MEYPQGATPLDKDELNGLKHPHISTRQELDALEQDNILAGLRWLRAQRKFSQDDLLTEGFITTLHKRMFGEVWRWAGQFRKTEKNIGIDPAQIPTALRNLLDDARYWIEHRTFGAAEFAARLHHRLVSIHPFPNGNGRATRLITDEIVSRYFDGFRPHWENSALITEGAHRQRYIAALRDADAGNYQPLVGFLSG
ncbi:Fic family protein [Alcanivorax sp. S71-1-4]|uniref:mobile mystery protein B n=1 Tax=Alcanivorax sp. S71-1-4 TaxID=1177159 RepID=UPI00135C234E|nr:mobile mystery protein B [Alcanivorax sp. S71-1-4]KAF0810129.1 Fic family protein [Alcanivorax sp. S71-1-4]